MFKFFLSPINPVRAYFTLAIAAMALGFFIWKPIYLSASNQAVLLYSRNVEHKCDLSEPNDFAFDWLHHAVRGLSSGKRSCQSIELQKVLGVSQNKLLLDAYLNYPQWYATVGDKYIVQIDGTLLDQSRVNLPEMKLLFQFSIKRDNGKCRLEKLEILTMGQDKKFRQFVSNLSNKGPSDVVARNKKTAKLVRYSQAWSSFDKKRSHLEFGRAIESNPNCSYLYYFEGTTYLSEGNFSSALANFDKCLSLDPQNPFALINRSASKCSLNDFAGSVYDSNAAVSFCPKNFFAQLNQGYDKHSYRNYEGAVESDTTALLQNPYCYDGYLNRSCAYEAVGNYEFALQDYASAINLYPKRPQAYMQRGVLLSHIDQPGKAIFDLNRALLLHESGSKLLKSELLAIYQNLYFCYSEMHMNKEALKYAELLNQASQKRLSVF